MPSYKEQKAALLGAQAELMSLYAKIEKKTPGINITLPNGKPLVYREEQFFFSDAVMNAILQHAILMIESQVGSGKTLGFLLPLILSMKNEKSGINKVIISTSSIALQRQLIEAIENVATKLGIKITVSISKGISNYACYSEATEAMYSAPTEEEETKIKKIRDSLFGMNSWDRDKFNQELINPYWNKICVKSTSLCRDCDLRERCEFLKEQAHIGKSKGLEFVIVNHAKLASLLRKKHSFVDYADVVVLDEAHSFLSQMRLVGESRINLGELERTLNNEILSHLRKHSDSDKIDGYRKLNSDTISPLTALQTYIRSSAKQLFRNNPNNAGITMKSVDKLNFEIDTPEFIEQAQKLVKALERIILFFSNNHLNDKIDDLKKDYECLKTCRTVLADMSKGNDSSYIYWANYDENKPFDIYFHEKDISKYLDKLYDRKTVIAASGTLSTSRVSKTPYSRSIRNLGLEGNPRLLEEDPIETPYHFDDCLLYHDPNMESPNNPDRKKYILALADRVIELIKATHGKALILFTSKKDMNAVYEIVKLADLDMPLILQNDSNTNECVERFKSEQDSCLFATGAFWEGIDIEGPALSNLIITKLPYPSDDPDIHYERKGLSQKEEMELLYEEMIMRLKQGFGRGKRGENDKVLFSILDPRFSRMSQELKKALPRDLNYTTSMQDVYKYSQENILNSEKKLV